MELRKWSAGTCKVHLNSIKKYIGYLRTPWVAEVCADDLSKLNTIQECMSSWTRSLTKLGNRHANEDEEEIVNPDNVQAFFASDRAKRAESLLKDPQQCIITQSAHTLVRNFIILSIMCASCNWAGIVQQMTGGILWREIEKR